MGVKTVDWCLCRLYHGCSNPLGHHGGKISCKPPTDPSCTQSLSCAVTINGSFMKICRAARIWDDDFKFSPKTKDIEYPEKTSKSSHLRRWHQKMLLDKLHHYQISLLINQLIISALIIPLVSQILFAGICPSVELVLWFNTKWCRNMLHVNEI